MTSDSLLRAQYTFLISLIKHKTKNRSRIMCLKFLKDIVSIGKKVLIVLGACLYFFDLGSDTATTIQLFSNCHTNYGIASICIIIGSLLVSIFIPSSILKLREEQLDCSSLKFWLHSLGFMISVGIRQAWWTSEKYP